MNIHDIFPGILKRRRAAAPTDQGRVSMHLGEIAPSVVIPSRTIQNPYKLVPRQGRNATGFLFVNEIKDGQDKESIEICKFVHRLERGVTRIHFPLAERGMPVRVNGKTGWTFVAEVYKHGENKCKMCVCLGKNGKHFIFNSKKVKLIRMQPGINHRETDQTGGPTFH